MSLTYVPFDELVLWQEKSQIKSGDGKPFGKYKMFVCSDTEVKRYDKFLINSEALIFGTGGKAMIMIPLCKNPIWWIHDYPKDIQEEYFKTHERIPASPISREAIVKKTFAIIIVILFLVILTWICGARTFVDGFLVSYALWLIIDLYDCFFLDWVLFANIKKIRLPGTEHMDKAYHQKMYHVVHSCVGMIVGLIPCLLTGVGIILIAH